MSPLPSSPPYPADDSSPLPAPRNASSGAISALREAGIPLDTAGDFHQWAMETCEADLGAPAVAHLRTGIDELATAYDLRSSAVEAIHDAYAPWLLGSASTGFGALAAGSTPAFPRPPFRPPPSSSSAPSDAEAARTGGVVTKYSGQRLGGHIVAPQPVRTTSIPLGRRHRRRYLCFPPRLPLARARHLTTSTCTPRTALSRHPGSARPNAPARTPDVAYGS
ncbi:unnamed protein product [Vitrella brassicaformis CCMP3155]|uniref:Uncharacterized protein n=1 Tax=Vitrella brassicaformis (strain CCMP3155) TaxID=1169540 RepID=A0A0G4GMV3_VITBC|nr:unnamed protein product [Vitrella brassicaformis CCMP3155]|eukprot:CEM31460.1 unnamed protein product [Vitrella brassicaformis CCMP3155]